WHEARLVRVLDAQDEGATVLAGEQEVVQRRAHTAHVQRAGGAGGETDFDGHVVKWIGGSAGRLPGCPVAGHCMGREGNRVRDAFLCPCRCEPTTMTTTGSQSVRPAGHRLV